MLCVSCERTSAERGGASETQPQRIVTLGGAVTEIVFALGAGDRVVGTDDSSVYPAEVRSLPRVGYHRAVSAEGALSLSPQLILGTEEAGPPAAIEQLRSAKLPVTLVTAAQDLDGARARMLEIGRLLGLESRAKALVAELDADLAKARRKTAEWPKKPRVLFVFARGSNTLSVAGKKTAAHAMIELAGAENAVSEYEGYRPLGSEAVLAADPDLIVATEAGGDGGLAGIAERPGLARTRAVRERAIETVDALAFLGFGPRTGKTLLAFVERLDRHAREVDEK